MTPVPEASLTIAPLVKMAMVKETPTMGVPAVSVTSTKVQPAVSPPTALSWTCSSFVGLARDGPGR